MTNIPLTWVLVPAAGALLLALPLGSLATALVLRRKGFAELSREALIAAGLALFAALLPPIGLGLSEVLGTSMAFAIPTTAALFLGLVANVLVAGTAGTFALEVYLVVGLCLLIGSIALKGLTEFAGLPTGPVLALMIAGLCVWSSLGGAGVALVGAVVLPTPDDPQPIR